MSHSASSLSTLSSALSSTWGAARNVLGFDLGLSAAASSFHLTASMSHEEIRELADSMADSWPAEVSFAMREKNQDILAIVQEFVSRCSQSAADEHAVWLHLLKTSLADEDLPMFEKGR